MALGLTRVYESFLSDAELGWTLDSEDLSYLRSRDGTKTAVNDVLGRTFVSHQNAVWKLIADLDTAVETPTLEGIMLLESVNKHTLELMMLQILLCIPCRLHKFPSLCYAKVNHVQLMCPAGRDYHDCGACQATIQNCRNQIKCVARMLRVIGDKRKSAEEATENQWSPGIEDLVSLGDIWRFVCQLINLDLQTTMETEKRGFQALYGPPANRMPVDTGAEGDNFDCDRKRQSVTKQVCKRKRTAKNFVLPPLIPCTAVVPPVPPPPAAPSATTTTDQSCDGGIFALFDHDTIQEFDDLLRTMDWIV